MKRLIYIAAALSMPLYSLAATPPSERIDRYTVLSNAASPEQLMPLNAVTSQRLRGTVDDGILQLLAGTGYQLFRRNAPESIGALLAKPIATTALRFRRVRIIEGIHAVAGPAVDVLVDPVNRLVSFEVKPDYRAGGVQ